MKKSFLIKKNRFLVNLRHFYNTYLNIVKKYFSSQFFFGGPIKFYCDSAGWSCFKDVSRSGILRTERDGEILLFRKVSFMILWCSPNKAITEIVAANGVVRIHPTKQM